MLTVELLKRPCKERGRPKAASMIAVPGSPRSAAGNAATTTVTAGTDPTRAATTGAGCPATCDVFNDRRRVLKLRVQACCTRRLGLRAGRHGHRSKHEHSCRQSHREFSHGNLPCVAE